MRPAPWAFLARQTEMSPSAPSGVQTSEVNMMKERWWTSALVIAALGLLGACASVQQFDVDAGSTSTGSGGSSGAVCGDGVIDDGEQCDGADLGGASCASVEGAGYFAPPGKALGCKPDCTFDTSACTNACIL